MVVEREEIWNPEIHYIDRKYFGLIPALQSWHCEKVYFKAWF